MTSRGPALRRLRVAAVPFILVGGASIATAQSPEPHAAPARAAERLPDLDQLAPEELAVVKRGSKRPRFRLGFASVFINRGSGPLILSARRRRSSDPLVADQRVALSDGSERTYRRVGRLRYERGGGHEHFHLPDFDRYELRRTADYRLARQDRKTGFCVQSSWRARGTREASVKVQELDWQDSDCGNRHPRRLLVEQGLLAGWGDDYAPYLEGQYIDITRLRAGRYYLVHRLNPRRRLRESRYSNNAASLHLSIRWPRGTRSKPSVRVLRRCQSSERCPGR